MDLFDLLLSLLKVTLTLRVLRSCFFYVLLLRLSELQYPHHDLIVKSFVKKKVIFKIAINIMPSLAFLDILIASA